MSKYAAVNVKFGADISEFSTAMQNAARQMKKAGEQLQAVGMSMTRNLTAPIVALGAAALYSYGQIDQLKRGLTTFMGTTQAAEAEFQKLREVAKLPGIGLEEAVRGSNNLQAVGLSADDARIAMMAFGKAIATIGGGREMFDLAIRGFSQLTNAAKPLQQDLYQIANQLPQVNKLMKDAFGTNRAEDLAAMGITGKQLADFLVKELGKLPPVTGGIKNSFENMSDSVKIALASFGEAIDRNFDISGKLTAFANWIGNVASGFQNLQPWIQKTILVVVGLVAAMGPLLLIVGGFVQIMPTLIAGFAAIRSAMLAITLVSAPLILEIGLIVAAVAAIVTVGVWAYQNWQVLKTHFVNLFKSLATGVMNAVIYMSKGLENFLEFFGVKGFTGVTAALEAMRDSIPDKEVAGKLMSIEEAFSKTWSSIKKNIYQNKPTAADILPEVKTSSGTKATGGNSISKELAEQQANELREQNESINRVLRDGYEETATVVQTGWLNIHQKQSEGGSFWMQQWAKLTADARQKFEQFNAQISSMLKDQLANVISDAFAQIGENLATGADPFKNVGKNMLDSVGQFLQKMGQAFITFGITYAIAEDSIISGNPYAAIAAGAAMVAAGAAISATRKKGIKGAAGDYSSDSGGYGGRTSSGEDLTLYTRLDGRDLVLSGQRTQAVSRR